MWGGGELGWGKEGGFGGWGEEIEGVMWVVGGVVRTILDPCCGWCFDINRVVLGQCW